MYKKAIIFLVKLLVTTALFTLLFRPETFGLADDFWGENISVQSLLDEIRAVETHNIVFWLGFATIVKMMGLLFGVLRWRLLLQGQGLKIPFWYMVQSWFIGRTIGIFLPGTIGLDGYRLYDSSLYTGEAIKSTTVIVIEKLIGIIAMTLLVFVTFPLGLRLLNFNIPMLVAAMTIFGGMVVVSLLTLLNPRVIQVCVAVIPTPAAVRNKFNKLGAAAAAYGGNRRTLLLAVLFGVLVHVGTCLMYFGTMSAIRADNTTIFDIFFTSPLMIWGTVLGPTVGGEGIREIVFTLCLGAKSGTTKAFLIAHLGWWVGELIPFLIGLPIFLLRSRPSKEEIQAKLAQAREEAGQADEGMHLAPEEVVSYRSKLINCALGGILGGLIAGALIGLGEAEWLSRSLGGLTELGAFWWGPLVYGILFTGVGLGVAGGLAFLYLLADRFPRPQVTFGLSLGGAVAAGTLIIGMFRFTRDVLAGHSPSPVQVACILAAALGIGLVMALGAVAVTSLVKGRRPLGVGAGIAAYLLLILFGLGAGAMRAPAPQSTAFDPPDQAKGPNIILIAIDALRADRLPLYCEEATAQTPNLQALAKDAINFENAFSQASWTKPSFATIFSGLYPEAHTATTKTSSLPGEVVTFPEGLLDAGYYTKGFANNPNITAVFNFHQGFVDYVDLKPELLFGASPSASKLSLYNVIRQVRQKVMGTIPGLGIAITDFYQPAETVTALGLEWLAGDERPKDAPCFLFLHYMDPHDPFMDWENPGVGYARARMGNPDPEKFLDPMNKAYDLEIEYLDKHLGLLFDGLKDMGLYDDALIVFTADHGEEFYDHEGWWHGQTLFDELIHIPLLVKLPKNQRAGQVNKKFARHIDLGPTILRFARAGKPDAMPGLPLLSLKGKFLNLDLDYVYAENDFENNVLQAVRTPDQKVIRANEGNPREHGPVEFYDLEADPGEQENLNDPENVEEAALLKLLDEMQAHVKENAAEPVLMEGTPEDLKEQLDALGYLGD